MSVANSLTHFSLWEPEKAPCIYYSWFEMPGATWGFSTASPASDLASRAQGSASLRRAPVWNPSSWARCALELCNAGSASPGAAHLSSELLSSVLSSEKRKQTRRVSGCCPHGVFSSQFLLPGSFLWAGQTPEGFPGACFWFNHSTEIKG